MSASPACSVIVPTYNRAALLRHTLDSLLRQRLAPGQWLDVLVVDDGSTDDTAGVVEAYRERMPVRYFFQEDRGYRVAAARNTGINAAAGPVCVLVDSGVILHSGAVAAHLAAHRAADGPAAVVGYVYCFNEGNEDGELIARALDYDDPDASMRSFGRDGRWLDIREDYYRRYGEDLSALVAPWLMYWTCNVSAPTGLLRTLGGFDETYRSWGGEDIDLGYRLHRAGARFALCREAASIHVPHPKSYHDNMRSAAGNYRYFADKFDDAVARLVPDHHFHDIEALIRARGLRPAGTPATPAPAAQPAFGAGATP